MSGVCQRLLCTSKLMLHSAGLHVSTYRGTKYEVRIGEDNQGKEEVSAPYQVRRLMYPYRRLS
jgi:hypothetical protein